MQQTTVERLRRILTLQGIDYDEFVAKPLSDILDEAYKKFGCSPEVDTRGPYPRLVAHEEIEKMLDDLN